MLDCLVNGELSVFLGADDRGLAFADGVWERVVVVNGHPWWWQDHFDRLVRGCERLGLTPPAQSVLLRELQTVTRGRPKTVVKMIITRGAGGGSYWPSENETETRIVAAYPFPEVPSRISQAGVPARLCEVRLAVQPALGGINPLNRLELVLAALENRAFPEHEGLLLDTNDHLISAIDSNLFLVMGDQLLTPRMDRSGVRGILRGRIIREFKARTELRRITMDMVPEASEAFVCDVVRGIVPLRSIDDHPLTIGSVTRELQDWLTERQNRQ